MALRNAIPLALALLAAAMSASAQDPLKSPECGAALQRLQAARAADAKSVPALREQAAGACLGAAVPASRSNRWAQPPIAVPPPVIDVPLLAAQPPVASQLPPPVPIQRPSTISSCDVNGCWTSEGTRLPRMGPLLIGPGGMPCPVQGASASCP
jgi:hypothetical protein